MSTALHKAVLEEQFGPRPESAAPTHLVRPGQTWPCDTPRCYKCHHWRSNLPLTGHCLLGVRGKGLMSSHDTMPGDGCSSKYAPMWTHEDGVIEAPSNSI